MRNLWEAHISSNLYNSAIKVPGTRWDKTDHKLYIEHSTVPHYDYSPDFTGLMKHQADSVCRALGELRFQNRWIVADDPGLGKAAVVVRIIAALGRPTLIVCPASVIKTWEHQLKEWCPSTHGLPDVDIASSDNLEKVGDASSYGLIVLDECHYFKNPNAARTKAARKLIDGKMCLGTTGTPAPNTIQDFCGLSQLFWPGRLGTWKPGAKYSFQFNNYFLEGENLGTQEEPRWIWGKLKEDKAEELNRRIKTLCSHHDWSEIEGDFRLVPGRIFIEMDRDVSRDYHQALSDGDKFRVFDDMATALCKIKLAHAERWVKEHAGQKVVLYTHLVDTAERLGKALGREAITGQIPAQKRGDFIKASGSIVVATMHSIGIGINDLADFDAALFVELYWKSDVIEQAASRLRRLCKEHSASIDFLIVSNTIEERMAAVLINKLDCLKRGGAATAFASEIDKALVGKSDAQLLADLFEQERNFEPELGEF